MRGRYRKIDNEVLQDPAWESLSPNARLLKFISDVSPRQTACGVLRSSISALSLESGLHPRAIRKAIEELIAGEFLFVVGKDSYFVPTFFKSNCSSDKFASQALKEVKSLWPTIHERFLQDNRDVEVLKKVMKENSSTADQQPVNALSTPTAFSLQHTDNSLQPSGGTDRGNGGGVFEAPPPAARQEQIPPKVRGLINGLIADIRAKTMSMENARSVLAGEGVIHLAHLLEETNDA